MAPFSKFLTIAFVVIAGLNSFYLAKSPTNYQTLNDSSGNRGTVNTSPFHANPVLSFPGKPDHESRPRFIAMGQDQHTAMSFDDPSDQSKPH